MADITFLEEQCIAYSEIIQMYDKIIRAWGRIVPTDVIIDQSFIIIQLNDTANILSQLKHSIDIY